MHAIKTILFSICVFTATALNAEAMLHPIFGEKIPFSTLRDKWVFINYWASWCEPCLEEIPELNRFYQRHKKDNVALFAVNYDMLPPDMQQQLVNDYHIHYPALQKDPARPLHLGDIRGVPVTFVFNPQGLLVQTLYGGQTATQLSRLIRNQ